MLNEVVDDDKEKRGERRDRMCDSNLDAVDSAASDMIGIVLRRVEAIGNFDRSSSESDDVSIRTLNATITYNDILYYNKKHITTSCIYSLFYDTGNSNLRNHDRFLVIV